MISVSEDGTIAVTNLNSGELHNKLHNFALNDKDKKRADSFMEDEKHGYKKLKRRYSFASNFSVNNYFYLVKIKSQKVFQSMSFATIAKIIEVKNLPEMLEKFNKKMLNIQKKNHTPDRRHEIEMMGTSEKHAGRRRGSDAGLLNSSEELGH